MLGERKEDKGKTLPAKKQENTHEDKNSEENKQTIQKNERTIDW